MSTRTLDYGMNNPFFAVIGRPRHLAWPVHAYRITIPATLNTGRELLNPFESVVLNVIDAVGGLDDGTLSQETCIPVDLVRNVTLRLRDRGFINKDNLIIDTQRSNWERETHEESYTSALAFRELVGGRLLPFVQVLDDRSPLKTKVIDQGIRTLPRDHTSSRLGAPSPREIIIAITQMKRRSGAHAQSTRSPTIEQIRVERQPEDYFLDCPIAIQAHDADFRVADPFGTGFSRVLEDVFSLCLETDERLQEWMLKWRQSLSAPNTRDGEESRPSEPFDTNQNRCRYPNLVRMLTPARGELHRSAKAIYASLEWALYYTCEMHDPQLAIRRLKQETGTSYSQWLSGITDGVGFTVPRAGFRPLPNGKFDDYVNQKPEMETVLAIALVQAEADHEHPLRRIAAAHPDFVEHIRTLARDRGGIAHGRAVDVATDAPLESDPFMRESIIMLLPAIRFDSDPKRTDAGSQADIRLDARTSLLNAFGYPSFNKLGPSAQASLLSAEQFWLVCKDGDDALSFVGHLYSALQGVLRSFLNEGAPLGIPEGEYKKRAEARAHEAGLGVLPKALASVNPRRIRETLQGNELTLGASVMTFLLTTSPEVLAGLGNAQPAFLTVIADIITKRGHLNQPVPMTRADVGKIRKSATSTVRTLLELTQED